MPYCPYQYPFIIYMPLAFVFIIILILAQSASAWSWPHLSASSTASNPDLASLDASPHIESSIPPNRQLRHSPDNPAPLFPG